MSSDASKPKTYAGSGVSLESAEKLSDRLASLLPKTFRPGCVALPGGFAGLFDLKQEGLEDALLVMSTDGVGTKIKLAVEFELYDGVGIDLVAMSVNDIITLGATPLCFLDYIAYSKLKAGVLEEMIGGIVAGCETSGAALIGGETAEMPDMYAEDHFDLAGFCLGAVKRDHVIDGKNVLAGDVLIGLPSSGLHSNGFSLVRAILKDCDVKEVAARKQELIAPTRIYSKEVQKLNETLKRGSVTGMAHITGGGLCGNIGRIIPEGLCARMQRTWSVPKIFTWLAKRGQVDEAEMFRVFNMGVGFVFVCRPEVKDKALSLLGDEACLLGEVVKSTGSERAELV